MSKYRKGWSTFPGHALERIPIGWNHPIDKNTLKINLLEHVLIGKVSQLFRNMLFFCNGPLPVNPFSRRSLPSLFCTGSAQGRHLMGLDEDRPTNLVARGRSKTSARGACCGLT